MHMDAHNKKTTNEQHSYENVDKTSKSSIWMHLRYMYERTP